MARTAATKARREASEQHANVFSIAKAHPGRIDWRVLEGGRDRVHEKPWQVFAYESPWNVVVRSRNDSGGGRRVCLASLDPAELGSRHAATSSRDNMERPRLIAGASRRSSSDPCTGR